MVGADFLDSLLSLKLIWSTPCLIKLSSIQEIIKLLSASVAAYIASSCSDAKISALLKLISTQQYHNCLLTTSGKFKKHSRIHILPLRVLKTMGSLTTHICRLRE